jgi:hypothetical protein
MRSHARAFFLVLGILGVYLFAAQAVSLPAAWGGETDSRLLDEALVPFQNLTPVSALVLSGALVCLLLPATFAGPGTVSRVAARVSWGKVLEAVFALNAVLVAVILGFLWFFTQSNIYLSDELATQTLGALFAAGLLECLIGTVLALTLVFLRKRKGLYFSTLVVHVAEVALLTVTFVLGIKA